jgi:cell division protease FtsH
MTKELAGVIGTSIFGLIAFKMLISDLNKGDVESRDLTASVIKGDNKFDDVYGGELIKHKFREIIDFLKFPQKYERFGARIRRGVLFYGPPGTGKTMLARALANESGCEFIKIAASEFQ